MGCVVDASVAICWFVPGQDTAESIALLDETQSTGAVLPGLWHAEVGNQLGLKLRRGLLSRADIDFALELVAGLDLVTDTSLRRLSWPVISFMNEHELTGYDAAYLALALKRKLPLATFDRELIVAARNLGTTLLGQPCTL